MQLTDFTVKFQDIYVSAFLGIWQRCTTRGAEIFVHLTGVICPGYGIWRQSFVKCQIPTPCAAAFPPPPALHGWVLQLNMALSYSVIHLRLLIYVIFCFLFNTLQVVVPRKKLVVI